MRDGQNFLLDVALAGQLVSDDKPRKMQEKPRTQGQRIYCPLTRLREDLVLVGTHSRYEVFYGGWLFDPGWNVRLTHNF